jgi:hypothetical protein
VSARIATALTRGLVAGAIGTAAMTVSSTLEMRARRRPPSLTPAKAVETVLEVEPKDEAAEQRLSNLAHWAYGTSWGAVRGLIDVLGVRGAAAAALHFAAVWGAAIVMLPSLRVAPPPAECGAEELAIDGFHHAVYAGATSAAYDVLGSMTRS